MTHSDRDILEWSLALNNTPVARVSRLPFAILSETIDDEYESADDSLDKTAEHSENGPNTDSASVPIMPEIYTLNKW